jgi:RES domain-containing protein
VLTAWRIVKSKYARDAFSGEGARLFGGRWNSPGLPLVYTAESQSLAALEMLVHLESADLLFHYVVFEVTFDRSLVKDLSHTHPKGWDADPVPNKIRAIGDRWASDRTSPILRVPSAIVHSEHNFLLNPGHPKFANIRIGKPTPFRVHSKLAGKFK